MTKVWNGIAAGRRRQWSGINYGPHLGTPGSSVDQAVTATRRSSERRAYCVLAGVLTYSQALATRSTFKECQASVGGSSAS
jgi:hypothetical protein